jgi:LacI family transcriptional regulator
MSPQVLLVFLTRFEESAAMLRGIAHYERLHRPWAAFLDDEARAETDPAWLRSKPWSGVISRHTSAALVQGCAELGIPLVDVNDTPPFPGVPKLRPDNVAIGHLGAEHFLERGFHHFGFCGFGNEPWSRERRDGFVEAVKLAGRTCEIFDVDYPGNVSPQWDAKQIPALAAWLRRLPKPVGVMSCADFRAIQVMSAAQGAGLLMPDEVALLGANNDAIRCELSHPPLSSVAPNAFQSGYQAAELLNEMMRGEPVGAVDMRIEPLGVVSRLSSDVLAIRDRNVAAALSSIRERASHGITVTEVVRRTTASRS